MCECYNPSGPKYCDMHKEMTGVERIINDDFRGENISKMSGDYR